MEENLIYESSTGGLIVTTHRVVQNGSVIFAPSGGCAASVSKPSVFSSCDIIIAGTEQVSDSYDVAEMSSLSLQTSTLIQRAGKGGTHLEIAKAVAEGTGVEFKIIRFKMSKPVARELASNLNAAFAKALDCWKTAAAQQAANTDAEIRSLKRL